MSLSLNAALATTVVAALVIFATRLFPFALFSKREPPPILRFVEKYIPPMITSTRKSTSWSGPPSARQ